MTTSLLGVEPDESGALRVDLVGDGAGGGAGGGERVYFASDGIGDPRYVGLRPRQLIAAVLNSALAYDHASKTGVVLHMMSAISEYGKFGAVCIGRDREHAAALMSDLRSLVRNIAETSG